ncbi:MAG: hypothetical protein IK104_01830 [Clostridia bacterium]|nr:hypothetical protein [Clostridia bacterium]
MEEKMTVSESELIKEALKDTAPDLAKIKETCLASLKGEETKHAKRAVFGRLAAAAAVLLIVGAYALVKNLPNKDPVLPTEPSPSGEQTDAPSETLPPGTTEPAGDPVVGDGVLIAEIERLNAGLSAYAQGAYYRVWNFYVPDKEANGLPNEMRTAPDAAACPEYQPTMYRVSEMHALYPSGAPKAAITDAYRAAAKETLARFLGELGITLDDLRETDPAENASFFRFRNGQEALPAGCRTEVHEVTNGEEENGAHPEEYFLAANPDGSYLVLAKPGHITLRYIGEAYAGDYEAQDALFGSAEAARATAAKDPYLSALCRLICGEGTVTAAVTEESLGLEGLDKLVSYKLYAENDDPAAAMENYLSRSVSLHALIEKNDPLSLTAQADFDLGNEDADDEKCADFPAVPYDRALELAKAQYFADFGVSPTLVTCELFYSSTGDMEYRVPVWRFWFRLNNLDFWRQQYISGSEEQMEAQRARVDDVYFYYEMRIPAYDLSSVYGNEDPMQGNR